MAPDINVDEKNLPNLNRLYVHPLFFVAGFIMHTALTVLFTVYVAPGIALAAGLTVVQTALLWIGISIGVFMLAIYRQDEMEGTVYAK